MALYESHALQKHTQSSGQRSDYHDIHVTCNSKKNNVTSSLSQHTHTHTHTHTDRENVAGLYHYPPVSGGCSSCLFFQDSSVESSEAGRGLQTADVSSTWVCRAPGLWCLSLDPGAPTAARGCSDGPQEGPGSGEMECKLNLFVFIKKWHSTNHTHYRNTRTELRSAE